MSNISNTYALGIRARFSLNIVFCICNICFAFVLHLFYLYYVFTFVLFVLCFFFFDIECVHDLYA